MRRLLFWTLAANIFFILFIAVLIGMNYKTGRAIEFLIVTPDGNPCQKFCLFGADPETMTYSQIQKILMHHPLLVGLHIESRPSTYDYLFGQTVDINHVPGLVSIIFHKRIYCTDIHYPECYAKPNVVYLKLLRKALPLATIIREIGIPDFVITSIGSSVVDLYYRNSRLRFTYRLTHDGVISEEDSLEAIDQFSAEVFNQFSGNGSHYLWPGFGVNLELLSPAPL